MPYSIRLRLGNRRHTGNFAKDGIEVGGAGGEVGVGGAEFAAMHDELSTNVDEGFGIGDGADGAASDFAMFLQAAAICFCTSIMSGSLTPGGRRGVDTYRQGQGR